MDMLKDEMSNPTVAAHTGGKTGNILNHYSESYQIKCLLTSALRNLHKS